MPIAITNGSVVVHVKVDYSEIDLVTLTTLVAGSPGVYGEKIFKTLDTGAYYYVDADDNIGEAGANTLDAGKAATDGPVDLSSGAYTYPPLTANVNNLDPTNGALTSDGVSILYFSNSSGAVRQVRGILAPSTSKTMVLYNYGPDVVRLRNENANSDAETRFAIGGNVNIGANEGLWVFYDSANQRWRALKL